MRLANPWQLSFWEFKILRWFTIIDYTLQNKLQDRTLHLASFFTTKDAYLGGPYIVILTDAKSFSPGTVLPLLYTSVKPSC